jgi:fatty acid hydroxylase family protein
MASLDFTHPWSWYLLWNLAGFAGSIVLNSFVEWGAHKFVMHRLNPIIPYGYLHTTSHHAKFGHDSTYETDDPVLKGHILFTWKEYLIFPIFCLALYAPVEFLIGRPILGGVLLAVFMGLEAFNRLHWFFHSPGGTWFERTWVFQFLKNHHRIHHEKMDTNLNVVFPLADWVMGTLRKQ